jgi:type VI secretion system protein ImpF
MAELAFQDRLQPALLDRLSDDMRSLVVIEVRTARAQLAEHGISVDAIEFALRPFGLRPWRPERSARGAPSDEAVVVLQFSGPADGATLARVRAAPVATSGQPRAVRDFAEVASRTVLNSNPENPEQRVVSMRKLRESVLRDLTWLLSTASFDTGRSLAGLPAVERSVINYGLPSVAGRGTSGLEPAEVARRLQRTLEFFEPRLTQVQVTPEFDSKDGDVHALKFRVEAELWGQPTPQRLLLRTQIDVETADVVVMDAESG